MSEVDGLGQWEQGLSEQQREALSRVASRLARSANAIEQTLDMVDHLADSGVLAALTETLRDLDETFSATVRPELMGMVANLMMVLGIVSQLSYEPFFQAAMHTAPAANEAYPAFRSRKEPLGLRETVRLLRSPDVAAALEVLVAVLRAQRVAG